ncbi:MAG: ABC transporter permease [Pseudonocardiales bacterium]|nr:MAG: ABC transporter permease [Pseudonocardiales bacterium]
MARFLARRFVALIALLLATSIVTFTLFFAGTADPAADSCGKSCTPDRIAAAKVALGLDKPLVTQYLQYMKGLVAGREMGPPSGRYHCDWPCFGRSFQDNQFVWDVIKRGLPYTLSIAIGAATIWLFFGVLFGVIAALNKGKFLDKAAVTLSALGVSLPVPLIGLVFLWLIVSRWHLLPYTNNAITSPWSPGGPLAWAKNYILPWITLALIYGASYVRLTRANMIETMGEDYIRTARAKGLPRATVTIKHGLRAAITPIVTIFGLDLGALLGGAVLTESIYSIPGIGKTAVQATFDSNLPVIMSVVLFAAFFIIVANIIVDIFYAVIDPRVRLA